MASVVDVRPRSAASVTANGMGQKIAPKTRRLISSLKRRSRQDGSDVTTAEPWSS
jgi:hypothetical protein